MTTSKKPVTLDKLQRTLGISETVRFCVSMGFNVYLRACIYAVVVGFESVRARVCFCDTVRVRVYSCGFGLETVRVCNDCEARDPQQARARPRHLRNGVCSVYLSVYLNICGCETVRVHFVM